MHTTISRFRQRLAFGTGPQVDSRTRSVPSSQERRGDRIPEHRLLLEWGAFGDCCHSFPAHPLPPRTLSHPGGRWHLTARFSRELFLRVQGMVPGSKPKSALRTVVQGDAVPLGPDAKDRPAFFPDSFLRVEHASLP